MHLYRLALQRPRQTMYAKSQGTSLENVYTPV